MRGVQVFQAGRHLLPRADVLTINHMMKLFNVRFQLKSVQTNALKKAGQRGSRKLLPALQRAPHVAPDSSDEEAERLELLGQQGR